MTIRSVLIANRGEIACRVIRGARSIGRRAIAVYSEADAGAPHVVLADAAECIGPAPAAESYLNIGSIIRAAQEAGADAVHPGYGFLAENAQFARACKEAGLVFIGPPADAIELMGNKAAAKRHMQEAGVPCVPGYEGAEQSEDAFLAAAQKIGYPVMVKAAAGGGGRGMRLVSAPEALPAALRLARSEAESAFGSGELILEKAILRPRHVELQVFADQQGSVIHLAERDCSVQRRHQKVIEEAPCPVMTTELRDAMGRTAIDAARSIGYVGAGTVEFLLDEAGDFYFLEMNTRLQVEHPVTEMVTGIDLVALQIRVAEGRALDLVQSDIVLDGHAIEVRLYAEDTSRDFMPSTGRIELWRRPAGEGIRVDEGVVSGSEISPFYDPMVAKIIAHAETREAARLHLIGALERTALFGVESNRDFLIRALKTDRFAAGEATTAFLEEEFGDDRTLGDSALAADAAVAAVLQYVLAGDDAMADSVAVSPALRDWTSSGALVSHYRYELAGEALDLAVSPRGGDRYRISAGEAQCWDISIARRAESEARIFIGDRARDILFSRPDPSRIYLSVDGRTGCFEDLRAGIAGAAEAAGTGRIVAAMHGLLVDLAVSPGDRVDKGDRLLVLEAMKMQHEITTGTAGIVTAVHFDVGQQVAAGELIMELEESGEDAA